MKYQKILQDLMDDEEEADQHSEGVLSSREGAGLIDSIEADDFDRGNHNNDNEYSSRGV